jgi:hypothetical protein
MPRLTCDTKVDYENLLRVLDICGGKPLAAEALCERIAPHRDLIDAMHAEDAKHRKG